MAPTYSSESRGDDSTIRLGGRDPRSYRARRRSARAQLHTQALRHVAAPRLARRDRRADPGARPARARGAGRPARSPDARRGRGARARRVGTRRRARQQRPLRRARPHRGGAARVQRARPPGRLVFVTPMDIELLTDGGPTESQTAERLFDFFAHAHTSLDLAVYDAHFHDDTGTRIIAALDAAEARGVRVRA